MTRALIEGEQAHAESDRNPHGYQQAVQQCVESSDAILYVQLLFEIEVSAVTSSAPNWKLGMILAFAFELKEKAGPTPVENITYGTFQLRQDGVCSL
jgi:hypothetical protein